MTQDYTPITDKDDLEALERLKSRGVTLGNIYATWVLWEQQEAGGLN